MSGSVPQHRRMPFAVQGYSSKSTSRRLARMNSRRQVSAQRRPWWLVGLFKSVVATTGQLPRINRDTGQGIISLRMSCPDASTWGSFTPDAHASIRHAHPCRGGLTQKQLMTHKVAALAYALNRPPRLRQGRACAQPGCPFPSAPTALLCCMHTACAACVPACVPACQVCQVPR